MAKPKPIIFQNTMDTTINQLLLNKKKKKRKQSLLFYSTYLIGQLPPEQSLSSKSDTSDNLK